MEMDVGIWNRLTRLVVLLLLAAALVGVGLCYAPLIQQNERKRKRILQLDAEIQREEAMGRQLKGSIDALNRDPKTIERLVRERLGYASPGETVIRFEAVSTNQPMR
jgi:cell division protein FtsB